MILDKISNAVKKELNLDLSFEFADKVADVCLNPSEIGKVSKYSGKPVEDLISALDKFFSGKLNDVIDSTEYLNGFYNIYISLPALSEELRDMRNDIDEYFVISDNKKKTVVFDYSSPNIAKPFSVGHLRSTVIGQANLNCHKTLGYKTIGINHIGDWGTQFGKLIVAIKKWGNESDIDKDPIRILGELYVKFHEEQEKDPSLEIEARRWFSKLEKGDREARRIWSKCIKWSLGEFERIYKELGICIDKVQGESFYQDQLKGVISELREKGILKKSKEAMIVELEDNPPALIAKSDGSTLYLTRDLAALKYRIKHYNPSKIVYHVGNDQSLHFTQLAKVAEKLGWIDGHEIFFAGHGLMRLSDGKMSTRKGRVVLLDDLIRESVSRSLEIIETKNPKLKNKHDIAKKIGISAIKYSDLSQNRKSDIVFSFDRAINLEGNSGPYLQYSYARAASLIRKFERMFPGSDCHITINEDFREIALLFVKSRYVLTKAADLSLPNLICEHAFKVANAFNSYYEKNRIIDNDRQSSGNRMGVIYLFKDLLGKFFDILGIERLEEI